MTLDELASIDLRLLVAFNALMEERSVSRAAERLNVTQPAMSRTLQRLRKLFLDQLFVRQSHGLAPTARAEQLNQQIRPLLDDLLGVLSPVDLQPQRLQRTFRIAVPDFFSQALIGPIMERLLHQAPGVKLVIRNFQEYSMEDLVTGQLEFAVGVQKQAPANVHARVLGYETGVCLVPRYHPCTEGPFTLERFLELRHVKFWLPGFNERNLIDEWLQKQNLKRNLVIDTNNLMTAVNAVLDSGMAMLFGKSVSRFIPGHERLKALPLPVPAEELPKVEVKLFWHRRYHNDPAHQWMRQLLSEVVSEVRQLQ